MGNGGLENAQAGIKIAGRNTNNLRYADDTALMAENERNQKQESEKADLKLNFQKNYNHGVLSHHFMVNRWGNNGNSDRLYFWGASKSLQMVTEAMKLKDTCSLEEKL